MEEDYNFTRNVFIAICNSYKVSLEDREFFLDEYDSMIRKVNSYVAPEHKCEPDAQNVPTQETLQNRKDS